MTVTAAAGIPTAEVEHLRSTIARLEEQKRADDDKRSRQVEELQKSRAETVTCQAEITATKAEIAAAKAEVAAAKAEVDAAKKAAAAAKADAATAETEAKHLRADALNATKVLQQQKDEAAAAEAAAAEAAVAAYREEENLAATFKATPVVYHLAVRTGAVRNAGTDANVHIKIIGEGGATEKVKLAKSEGHKDKFEKGKTDKFVVEKPDVGRVTSIVIGHDGKGLGSGWYLDTVTLDVPALGKRYSFVADRWLAKDEGDGKLEIELFAEEGVMQQYKPTSSYVAYVHTSDVSGASLDKANVFLIVYGSDGRKSDEIPLQHSEGKRSAMFQNADIDEFRLDFEDVGEMQKIRIWHDNQGMFGATWHLADVELHDLKTDIRYRFAANRWLSKKHGDKTTIAELPVTSVVKDGVETQVVNTAVIYEVSVVTGDLRGSGTDANVFCILNGATGDTGERPMKQSKTHGGLLGNMFETGHTDVFDIEAVNLGELQSLKIWHDNKVCWLNEVCVVLGDLGLLP